MSNDDMYPTIIDDIVIVPIEIRQGVTVKIALPANLTKAEAEKVAAVIIAYASGS